MLRNHGEAALEIRTSASKIAAAPSCESGTRFASIESVMRLDLDDSERMELQTALEVQLRSLRGELAHTDDRDYRRSVRERLDRLEQVASRVTPAQEAVASESGASSLSARSVMHTHPLTAVREDLVLDVSARMAEQGVRHMPVVDRAGHLIGIVSDRDVRQAIGSPVRLSADAITPEALATLTVGAIMSRDPVHVTCEAPLFDLARLFVNRAIGAIPVVDDDAQVIGIVSYMDVLSRLASELQRLNRNRRLA